MAGAKTGGNFDAWLLPELNPDVTGSGIGRLKNDLKSDPADTWNRKSTAGARLESDRAVWHGQKATRGESVCVNSKRIPSQYSYRIESDLPYRQHKAGTAKVESN